MIGRSGSKNPCWAHSKDLHQGEQRLFTSETPALSSICTIIYHQNIGDEELKITPFILKSSHDKQAWQPWNENLELSWFVSVIEYL